MRTARLTPLGWRINVINSQEEELSRHARTGLVSSLGGVAIVLSAFVDLASPVSNIIFFSSFLASQNVCIIKNLWGKPSDILFLSPIKFLSYPSLCLRIFVFLTLLLTWDSGSVLWIRIESLFFFRSDCSFDLSPCLRFDSNANFTALCYLAGNSRSEYVDRSK